MSFLDQHIIEDISVYLDYVKQQESTLQSLETQKEVFKTAFFE
jgi:hypothetical protein